MKRITMLLGAAMLILCSMVYAAVPQLINFQGILKDGSGNPVANGSYSVQFTIYDAPSGGTNLWSETQSVTTSSGLFTVLLGSVTPVPATAFDNPDRWLGIKVGADPEMTPRQRLSSVGYSYNSSEWTSAAGNLFRLNGNVGIGTSSPQRKLDVSGDGGFASSARILNTSASGQAFLTLQKTGGTAPNEWLLGLDLNAAGSTRDFWIHDNVAGQTRFLINASGNVGIGTNDPQRKLDVSGDGGFASSARILNTSASGQAFLTLQKTGGTAPNEWLLGLDLNAAGSTRDFWIHDNVAGQTRFLINASGNVGIGTTAPDERLQVKNPGDDGAIIRIGGNSTAFIEKKIRFGDGDFVSIGESGVVDDRLEIKAAAVGVGTNTPNSRLQVSGAIATVVTTTASNLTLNDGHSVVLCNNGVPITIFLPTAVGIAGRQYTIKAYGAFAPITIDANGSEGIDGSLTYSLLASNKYVVIVSDGANWVVVGNN